MNNEYGIVIVSQSADVAKGIVSILWEVAKDVPITYAGGTETGGIGTSPESIQHALTSNNAKNLLVFYDFDRTKLCIEKVIKKNEWKLIVFDVALLEGAYVTAALLHVDASIEKINADLARLQIE